MAAESQHLAAATQQADNKGGNRKWADLLQNSSKPSSAFQLRKWSEEDRTIAKEELRHLGFCLVAYILGRFPGALAVDNVRKSWNVDSSCSLHERGWLIFRFHNEEDRDSVLHKGPYETFGTPWLMKKLPPFFKFTEDSFSSVPTWIRLQGLPLECWTQNALGKLASFVGEPLAADECTATMAKTSFARILVEVDVTQPLVRQICTTLPDGSRLVQNVVYEREPQLCSKCKRIGHKAEECRMQSGSRKVLNAQHHLAETEEAHLEQMANAVGNNVSRVDQFRPSTSAHVPEQTTNKTPLSGKKVQKRPQTAAALTSNQAKADSSPGILQISAAVDQVPQQYRQNKHQLGRSAIKGSSKESIQVAVNDGSRPAAETKTHSMTVADDVSMVAGQATGPLDAQKGNECMQTTGATAGMVQQQSGQLGADATIQLKQGCQQGILQAPADVQPENLLGDHTLTAAHLLEEAKLAALEAEFPPLAAGDSGRRRMPARKVSAAKLPAANAKKMQQGTDLQAAAASASEITLASPDIHHENKQQDNAAATANKMQQLPELQAPADTAQDQPISIADVSNLAQDDTPNTAPEAGNISHAAGIQETKKPTGPKWKQNRQTRSAKKRGPSQASPT